MEYFILGCIISIAAYQAFQIGIREGAERTIRKLHEEKIISVDRGGEISPNMFYKKDKV
jgi:hypothetical protein